MPLPQVRPGLRPPWPVFAVTALVALLRGLPFFVLTTSAAPAGRFFLPIGYNAMDVLAYVAFIRQAATSPSLTLHNPFTTLPHDGRLILLFHQALGLLCRLTGLDAFLMLELSRIPLLFLFFWLVWRLLERVLTTRAHRLWALWLIALSGGWHAYVLPFLDSGSAVAQVARDDFWAANGWSTFEAAHNPLWLAGLVLVVPLLGHVLAPEPQPKWQTHIAYCVGLIVLWFVHPYSALAVLAIVGVQPLLLAVFDAPMRPTLLRTWPAAIAAVAVLAAASAWQLADPVYLASSGGALGIRLVTIFWYPLTFGLLFVFALRGMRDLVVARHPWRFGLAAWLLAVTFLHSSPVLNGYHFLYFLHLPLCIVAAPSIAATFERCSASARPLAWSLAALLFLAPVAVTGQAVFEGLRDHKVSTETMAILTRLANEPPGNVLAPPAIARLVPAYTGHRADASHWFLSPGYEKQATEINVFFNAAELNSVALGQLMTRTQTRMIVLPRQLVPAALVALARQQPHEIAFETQSLLLLQRPFGQ